MRATLILLALFATGANAEIAAHVTAPNGRLLLLHDTAGHCKDGSMLAELNGPAGKMFQGCWTLHPGRVHVDWDDGDKSDVPMGVFKLGLPPST